MSTSSLQTWSYNYPFFSPFVSGQDEQYIQITASNASVNTRFSSLGNSSIIFPLQSNYQFLKTDQMMMIGDYELYNGSTLVTGAPAVISEQGISRAFSQVLVKIGAFTVETLQYNELTGQFMSTLTGRKTKYLKLFEGFQQPDVFQATGKARFALRVMSSLFYNAQALPLPCIAGLSLEFMLAPIQELALGATVTEMVINNPYIRALAISPDPAYTIALQSKIARGGSLWLPMIESRTTQTNGYGSDIIDVVTPVGVYSSIDSVSHTMYSRVAFNVRANDKYKRYAYQGLKNWSVQIGNLINPQTRYFTCGPGDQCLETLLVTLMSSCGSLDNLEDFCELQGSTRTEMLTNYLDKYFRFGINWTSSNEQFGSGVDLTAASSTNLVTHLEFAAPVTNDLVIATTVTASVLLEINNQQPMVWKQLPALAQG